jgi:hypothetical protein
MKNVHLLPTDKPTRLSILNSGKLNFGVEVMSSSNSKPQHIYITSNEFIEEGDFGLNISTKEIVKYNGVKGLNSYYKKIILTTDQDLIADGVQAIDDKFLQWFVKNPSCESVEVGYGWIRLTETDNEGYWISIPNEQIEMQQEEPDYTALLQPVGTRQETLEEAANIFSNGFQLHLKIDNVKSLRKGFIAGAKWQAERMYSEKDLISFYDFIENHQLRKYGNVWKRITNDSNVRPFNFESVDDEYIIKWFEQFKKKQ